MYCTLEKKKNLNVQSSYSLITVIKITLKYINTNFKTLLIIYILYYILIYNVITLKKAYF